jgi:cyclopropane-fatty-acyl-phospholipid synthase
MKEYFSSDEAIARPEVKQPVALKLSRPRWIAAYFARFKALEEGRLTIVLPDGGQWTVGAGEPHAIVRLFSFAPIRRYLFGGDLGFAESYMAGEWDCPDLTTFFNLVIRNENIFGLEGGGIWMKRAMRRFYHRRRGNSREGSKRNIAFHYDLGNDFYRRWLDETMTYSSAWFEDENQGLEQAQLNKYQTIAKLAEFQAGQSVLEIGCGWGGFSELAAIDHGVKIRGLTLSQEQLDYAQQRYRSKGIENLAEVAFCDYRDELGQYDRIVSIEMFEAVGEENWDTYFQAVYDRLKPGGKAVLQVITINEDRYERYRDETDFIQRYIFPGGMLPSCTVFAESVKKNGLKLTTTQKFGTSYAETLRHWQRRFQHAWPEIAKDGFDLKFKRMWEYYLSYCESGFDAGAIDVCLFKIEKPA